MARRHSREGGGRMAQVVDGAKVLEPDIARALEAWVITFMSERAGKGEEVKVTTRDGQHMDNSWDFQEFFTELYQQCPDAVARMLQAGGAGYIQQGDDHAPFS